MLSSEEFQQWNLSRRWSLATTGVIADVRAAPPTRRVKSRSGNVSGRYPSQKMGLTIQFESHTLELAGIYQMEYDSDVLEYYDQPPSIKLNYKSKNERNVGVWHTPDFFVLRQKEAGWEEWKTVKELSKLTDKMPHRYIIDDDHQWRCPPGEAYANSLGLYYRLRTDAETDWILQNNLRFLEDYFRGTSITVESKQQALITTLITKQSGITLAELIDQGGEPDNIYTLLVEQELQIDLHQASLSQNPGLVNVFPNEYKKIGSEQPKSQVQNSEIQLIAPPETKTKKMEQLLDSASPEDCAEANRRYQIIAPYLSADKPAQNQEVSTRTIQRWLSRWHKAEQLYGSGYVGLLPRINQKGNRKQKLPSLTHKLIAEYIAKDYETYKQKSKRAVYGALVNACERENIAVPSYKTFLKFCNNRPSYEQTKKRQGSRSAYPNEPLYWELEFTTPRHGDRPWAICHLDHTQLDIELVSSKTKALLGRPWVTFLSDAYSK